MKRFFTILLSAVHMLLILCLLLLSLLFSYLAVTGEATLFGYTASLVDLDGVTLTLTAGEEFILQEGDVILLRRADGTIFSAETVCATAVAVYYYDEQDTLAAVPLASPEFAGKLLFQSRALGAVLHIVGTPPVKWIVLGGMGLLFSGCIVVLLVLRSRRNRSRNDPAWDADELLLKEFSPMEETLIRTELLSEEAVLEEKMPGEMNADTPDPEETGGNEAASALAEDSALDKAADEETAAEDSEPGKSVSEEAGKTKTDELSSAPVTEEANEEEPDTDNTVLEETDTVIVLPGEA